VTFPYIAAIRPHRKDKRWFRGLPDEPFRLRKPYPREFSEEDLAPRPDRGEPVCIVFRSGGVLLRWRLPPGPTTDVSSDTVRRISHLIRKNWRHSS
jgi:hypothetical protein